MQQVYLRPEINKWQPKIQKGKLSMYINMNKPKLNESNILNKEVIHTLLIVVIKEKIKGTNRNASLLL